MNTAKKEQHQLTFYTYPSCTSCRKAKDWLEKNGVNYVERHLTKTPPSPEELMEIIKKTSSGMDEIMSTRSVKFKTLGVDIEDMSVSEVLRMLSDEPDLLKKPILTDGEKVVVGFHSAEMERFLQ